ncbi:glycoside hydrolase family 3 C-terminal domain-containing protein [Marinilabilia salmonicolor]|uniref:glycoside hydrolase family 3 C-terminal domain-containing protein n=1 Tax=Marinilabilia salmonicolor TaxID=989 RepID=UPI001F30E093|nr:glycoside hydrolase family 3 C-terminal domain-containing protein [Marinilabilia salmonicolor]
MKNDERILPFSEELKTIAVVGSLADAPHDQMGTWVFDGEKEQVITPIEALQKTYGDKVEIIFEPTIKYSRDKDKGSFGKALNAAKRADAVIAFVGEEAILSGEAHSLANIDLQGVQSNLIKELSKIDIPLITVVMAGRPLTIENEVEMSDAVLYAWHPGTMGGPAIADILFGRSIPSGKLPVTFPRMVGQVPVYYNHNSTGRPARGTEVLLDDIPLEARQSSLGNRSYYLDAGFDPLFHFGHGLSYTTFEYKNLRLSAKEFQKPDSIKVKVNVSNTGSLDATEIVQFYISDKSASIVRPVKELKGFQRVFIEAGKKKEVVFSISASSLGFWDSEGDYLVEPGTFSLMVGGNSLSGLNGEIFLIE